MIVPILVWAWIAAWGIVLACVFLAIARHLRDIQRYKTPGISDAELPHAAVVLCLRGADPFLRECLDRLAAQDYPRFEVWIVMDADTDPASRVVAEWFESQQDVSHIKRTYVDRGNLSDHASLKANAVHQALARMSDDIDAVVLVDADTLTHPQWLRQMVAPLVAADEDGVQRTGVVSGQIWYSPQGRSMGSLVRFACNGFSLAPMQWIGTIWAGSLSVHRRVFRHERFLPRLRETSCDEHAVLNTMHDVNMRLAFTQDCLMLNREECRLPACFRLMQRQLLWTRLGNGHWTTTFTAIVLACTMLLAGFALLTVALASGHVVAAVATDLSLWALLFFHLAMLEWLHRGVSRRMQSAQGTQPVTITWKARLRLALALTIALPFYTLAAAAATFTRRVSWRGISYRIDAQGRIRMLDYAPYVEASAAPQSNYSL